VDDAERLAHRQPALFVGGAFALGLLAARFLKSSKPRPSTGRQSWANTGYQPRFGYTDYGAGMSVPSSGGYGTSASSTGGYGTEATRSPASYGSSARPASSSLADSPYPTGATGGAEPETGYTPTV